MKLSRRLAVLLAVLVLPDADARGDQALRVPVVNGLVLDGRMDEAGWETAAKLPADQVMVPKPTAGQVVSPLNGFRGTLQLSVSMRPDVRLAISGGRLWVGVGASEDPGTSMGLHLLIAPAGARSAAEAVSLGYRPVEVRAPRHAVRGPRGVGRPFYRFEGAADWTRAGRWSLEASVPVADLALPSNTTALRLALVVFTRTPNVVSAAPSGALWTAPERWLELLPPEGGWPGPAEVDDERLEKEDAADRKRRLAWLAYLKGSSVPLQMHLSRKKVLSHLRELLFDPLENVLHHQPDLKVPVLTIRGDLKHRIGRLDEAAEDFREVLRIAPGWREARFGLHLKVRAVQLAEGPLGGPTDFAAAFARLDALEEKKLTPWALDGARLARALLLYKQGRFIEADFETFRQRYPQDPFMDEHAKLVKQGAMAAMQEKRRLEKAKDAKLPRAEVKTTAGTFTIELFQDVAPNTVNNFVWLARKGFYDGLAVHRTVPYFLAQMGDPCTRAKGKAAGMGTPGYAIRSEVSGRPALRGMVAMANAGRDTEGCQFFVLTGSALHIEREASFFGRVLEGQAVVDVLKQGDRLESIRLSGLDPQRPYRPTTVAGRPAPEPVDDCPGR